MERNVLDGVGRGGRLQEQFEGPCLRSVGVVRSRVRRGKSDRDGRNVRDGVGRGRRLPERFEGPPVEVEVEVEGALRKDGPR